MPTVDFLPIPAILQPEISTETEEVTANTLPTVYDLKIEVEDDSQQSTNSQPTPEENVQLTTNTRHEWINREPWTVIICNKGANRRPILYTISKKGKYAAIWHSQHWQSARQQYLANTQRRTVGNSEYTDGVANTASGGLGDGNSSIGSDGSYLSEFQPEKVAVRWENLIANSGFTNTVGNDEG